MSSRLLAPILVIALLIPVAAAAAGPADPSAAPAVSLPWLDTKAACNATDAIATPADPGEAQAPILPDTPFTQREEKAGFCSPGSCDQFCVNVCCGYPYGQCIRHPDGVCRAPCWCSC